MSWSPPTAKSGKHCLLTSSRHSHLRISRYNQHTEDALDLDLNPIQFMMKRYPDRKIGGYPVEEQGWRAIVGRYGLTGEEQVTDQ
jgi:ATP-binding cassette subfamily F protein 2